LSYKTLGFFHSIKKTGWAVPAIAVLIGACSTPACRSSSRVKASGDRKPAPDFSLKDADGKTVQLSDYRGKVVLLNFWATWCGPCKIEIPWFIDFEREHKDQGFAVVGISMDEDGWQAVRPFISEAGINYRVLLGNDSISQLYGGVEALPTTFLIDRDGRIASVHEGLVSKGTYEHDLEQLFQGASGARASGVPVVVARAN
jgi:cytochrome c biogenesis protein CcmG/thiol:disulfide interchange protein DsbE